MPYKSGCVCKLLLPIKKIKKRVYHKKVLTLLPKRLGVLMLETQAEIIPFDKFGNANFGIKRYFLCFTISNNKFPIL